MISKLHLPKNSKLRKILKLEILGASRLELEFDKANF